MSKKSRLRLASAACSSESAGIRLYVISVTAAMDMAVGKESLDDWPKMRFSGLVTELRCRRLRTS